MIANIFRRGWAGALCLLLLLGAGITPATAWAQGQGKKGTAKELPLHITAARLEADQKERVITFSGKVKAEYGDSILYAESLRVYYEPPAAGAKPKAPEPKDTSPLGDLGGEKINRIVASGGVRFVQQDRVATGKEATYYRAKELVVLTGNPQVWRAENTLKGERIVFNLRTNKVTVESSPKKRVEAHLYPTGQNVPGGTKSFLPGPKSRKAR
ncbi:MAG: LptA/OstA family protein [Syntrophales bacterium]|nr:LptA/OstA family protein [Syntrophales bacterium]